MTLAYHQIRDVSEQRLIELAFASSANDDDIIFVMRFIKNTL